MAYPTRTFAVHYAATGKLYACFITQQARGKQAVRLLQGIYAAILNAFIFLEYFTNDRDLKQFLMVCAWYSVVQTRSSQH